MLKPLATQGAADIGQRVRCMAGYDGRGGMSVLQIHPISNDTPVSDELDEKVHPPKVLTCTATIAKPVQGNAIALHRIIEKDLGCKKHWLEDVARFKPAEAAQRSAAQRSASCAAQLGCHS